MRPSLEETEKVDNKAISNAWKECASESPFYTAVMAAGLKSKQFVENKIDNAVRPFSNHRALYPQTSEVNQTVDSSKRKTENEF